jgi:hypothetical protein
MEDMYNLDKNKKDIGSEAPDEINGRFSTLGWAKQFKTYGERHQNFDWTRPNSAAAAETTGLGADNSRPTQRQQDHYLR